MASVTKAQRRTAVNYIGNALIRLANRDDEQAVKHLTLARMALDVELSSAPGLHRCPEMPNACTIKIYPTGFAALRMKDTDVCGQLTWCPWCGKRITAVAPVASPDSPSEQEA